MKQGCEEKGRTSQGGPVTPKAGCGGSREPGHTAQPKMPRGAFSEVESSTDMGLGKTFSWPGHCEGHSTHTCQTSDDSISNTSDTTFTESRVGGQKEGLRVARNGGAPHKALAISFSSPKLKISTTSLVRPSIAVWKTHA